MAAEDDARRDRNRSGSGGGVRPHGRPSPPIAVPGAGDDVGDDGDGFLRFHRGSSSEDEGASLIFSASSLGTRTAADHHAAGGHRFLPSSWDCRRSARASPSSSARGAGIYVSTPRGNLRLPDLDLREARRTAALAEANRRLRSSPASAEFSSRKRGGRVRSRSLGSERAAGGEPCDETSLLGERFLRKKTLSGLSLLDLNGGGCVEHEERYDSRLEDRNENYDNQQEEYGESYGATTTIYTEPLKTPEDESGPPLKTSQSCTIHDLNPHPPSNEETILDELRREFASQSNPPLLSLLYALVNASIVLPVLMSFGSIIYRDPFFRPYLSTLMKLTAVSGAVHQVAFSTVSSLPFAVGQVQDAGLIFLSAMARDLVSQLQRTGHDDAEILATVTVGLSASTAVLGCALVAVGKCELASRCRLLPSSVVGGYLAYIGFFCGQAGLALASSADVSNLSEWGAFLEPRALTLAAPGVAGGVVIYAAVRTMRHVAVLPTCVAGLLAGFYGVLWTTGTSVREATEGGWINQTPESPAWYHTWDFLRIEKVVWNVLPSQTLAVLAMICVVALSSSLDIAAIEIEMKRPLDYNHELKTVGISNIVSGLSGGYTGSYIFSQTIFSLRMGIRSRLMGFLLAFFLVVAVIMPINILAYIPNFFFGSLLMMICLDLMFEWLVDVREKVTPAEYVILVSTFALLQVLGVVFGIIAGFVLYIIVEKMGYDVGKDAKLNEDDVTASNT
ncbi:hypothetical protein ACHAWF_009520 [Thalassiosira exigua]